MTPLDADNRRRCIAEAQACAPLDAAVLLIRYNHRVHRGDQPPLGLAEVFPALADDAAALQTRAQAMWQQAMAVALAHYGYPDATRSAEDERARLALLHPGFHAASYDLAVQDALIALR